MANRTAASVLAIVLRKLGRIERQFGFRSHDFLSHTVTWTKVPMDVQNTYMTLWDVVQDVNRTKWNKADPVYVKACVMAGYPHA
jgi:hypothetical protein